MIDNPANDQLGRYLPDTIVERDEWTDLLGYAWRTFYRARQHGDIVAVDLYGRPVVLIELTTDPKFVLSPDQVREYRDKHGERLVRPVAA